MSKTFTRGKVVLDVSVDLNSGNIVKDLEKKFKVLDKYADDRCVNLQMEVDESGKVQLSNYLKDLNAEAAKGIVINFNESMSTAQLGKIGSEYKQWATKLAEELTSILSGAITSVSGSSGESIVDGIVGSNAELSKIDKMRKQIDDVTASIKEKQSAVIDLQKQIERQAKAEEEAIDRVQRAHRKYQKYETDASAKAFAVEYDDFLDKGYDDSKLAYKSESGKVKTADALSSDYEYIIDDLKLTDKKLSNAKKKLAQNQDEAINLTYKDMLGIEQSINSISAELKELESLKSKLTAELDGLLKEQEKFNKKQEELNKKKADRKTKKSQVKSDVSKDDGVEPGGNNQVTPPSEPLEISVTPTNLQNFYETIEKYKNAEISVKAAKQSLNELYSAVVGELDRASESSSMKFVQSAANRNAQSKSTKHYSIVGLENLRSNYEDLFVKNIGNDVAAYEKEFKNLFNMFSQKSSISETDVVRLISLENAYQRVFDQQVNLQNLASDAGYEFAKIEKKYDSLTGRFEKLKSRKLVDGIKTEISGDDIVDVQINPINIEDFYHKIENYSTLDLRADISKKSVDNINNNIKGILDNLKKVIDGVDEAKSSAMQAKKDVVKQQTKSSDVKTVNQLPSVKEQATTWTTRMKDHVKAYSKSDSDALIQRMGAIIKQAVDSETKKLNRAQEAELAALEKVYQTKYDSKWSVGDILSKQNLDKNSIFTDYQDLLGLFKDRSLNNAILKLKEKLEEAKNQASEIGIDGKGGKKEDKPPVVVPVELDPDMAKLQEKLKNIEPKLQVEVDLNPSAESLQKISQAASSGISQQLNGSVVGQQPAASSSKPKQSLSKAKQKAFEEINWSWATSYTKSEDEIYDWITNIFKGYVNKGKKLTEKDAMKIASLKEMYKLKSKASGKEKTSPVSDILKALGVTNFDDVLGESYSKGKKIFDEWSAYTATNGASSNKLESNVNKPGNNVTVDVDLNPNIAKLRSDLKTISPPLDVNVNPVANDGSGKKSKRGTSATALTNSINAIAPAFDESAAKVDAAADKHVASIRKIRDEISNLKQELVSVGATSITEITKIDSDEVNIKQLADSVKAEQEALKKEREKFVKQQEKFVKQQEKLQKQKEALAKKEESFKKKQEAIKKKQDKTGKKEDDKSDKYKLTDTDKNNINKLKSQYQDIVDEINPENILEQMISVDGKNILLSEQIKSVKNNAKNAINDLSTEVFENKDAFEAAKQKVSEYIDELTDLYSKENQKTYQQGKKESVYVDSFIAEKTLQETGVDQIEAQIKSVFENLGYEAVEFKNKFDRSLNEVDITLFKDGVATKTKVQLREITDEAGRTSIAINRLGDTEERVIGIGEKWVSGLKSKLGNLTQYVTGIELVMRAWNEAKQGFEFVKELDTSMTTIYQTMDITREGLDELSIGAIEAAKNLGAVSDQMINSVNIYAAYGKTVDEILSQATPTVMLANAMQGDAETASDYIQGVVQQYKELEGQETKIVNIFEKLGSQVQIDFPKAVASIAEGVQTAGSVMREAGVDFELYGASIAKVAETTRLEGTQIANAMKTIAARVSRNKVGDEEVSSEERSATAKAYGSVGINVYNDDGSYRGLANILDELSEKWDTLTDAQKAYVAEQSAGVRNINIFNTMLDTWEEARELAIESVEDSDYYLEVQEKHMESMQAKLNTLRATIQEFWYNLIETEVVDFGISTLTKVVQLGETIINVFKGVGSVFGELGGQIGAIGGATATVIAAASAWTSWTKKLSITEELSDGKTKTTTKNAGISGLWSDLQKLGDKAKKVGGLFVDGFKGANGIMSGLAGGVKNVWNNVGNLGKAFMGLSAATAIAWAISAGFDYLTESTEETSEAVKKLKEDLEASQQELKSHKKVINSVSDDYERLSRGVDLKTNKNLSLTTDEHERYVDICNQIADIYPSLVHSYDEQGNAVLKLKGRVAELNAEYEKERLNAARTNAANLDTYTTDFNNKTGNREFATAVADALGDWDKSTNVGGSITAGDVIPVLESIMTMTVDEINDYLTQLHADGQSQGLYRYLTGDEVLALGFFDSFMGGAARISEEQFKSVRGKIPTLIAKYTSIIDDSAANIKSSMQSLLLTMQLDSDLYPEFKNVDGALFNNINALLGGLTSDTITDIMDEVDLSAYVYDLVSKLSASPEAQISLGNILGITSETEMEELEKILVDDLKILSQKLGESEEGLKVKFGLDDDAKIIEDYHDFVDKTAKKIDKEQNSNIKQTKKMERLMRDVHDVYEDVETSAEQVRNFIKQQGVNTSEELTLLNHCVETTETWADAMAKFKLLHVSKDFETIIETLKSGYSSAKTHIENVNDAISASNSSLGLSEEQIKNVVAAFEGLDGYDYDELFESTASGVRLNAHELEKLNAEYERTEKAKYTETLDDMEKEYIELCKAVVKAGSAEEQLEAIAKRNTLKKQIEEVQELTSQFGGLTSAYTKWKNAQDTTDQHEMYDDIFSGLEEIDKLYQRDLTGTDTFKAYMQQFYYGDLDEYLASAGKSYEQFYKEKAATIQKYFTEDNTGSINFLNALADKEDAEGNPFATVEDGIWTINGDIEEMAKAFGWATSTIDAQFKKLEAHEFSFKFVETDPLDGLKAKAVSAADDLKKIFGDMYTVDINTEDVGAIDQYLKQLHILSKSSGLTADQLDLVNDQIEYLTAKKGELTDAVEVKFKMDATVAELDICIQKLKDLGKEVNINLNPTSVEQANTELSKAETLLQSFANSEGVIDINTPGAQEALTILANLRQSLAMLNDNSAVMKVDTSKVTGDMAVAIQNIQTYQEAVHQLETLNTINSEYNLNLDTSKATQQVADALAQVQATDKTILTTLGVDPTSADSINQWIKDTTPEDLIVKAKINEDAIIGYTPDSKEAEVIYKVNRVQVDAFLSSNVDKKATLTYEVNTVGEVEIPVSSGSSPYFVNGTAHVGGTAYAKGNWGATEDETALVGELGSELRVNSKTGEWELLGKNGAEFADINKGDIIFNHRQTEELLKNGHVTSGGGRGKAFASGNAEGSKWYEGWFQKGALEDGFSLKNIFKTIVGSVRDVGENLVAGIAGLPEKIIDGITMVGTAANRSKMMEAANNEAIYNALTGNQESVEAVMDKYQDMQAGIEQAASEFVAKDLYDASEVAKTLTASELQTRITGIDPAVDSAFAEKSDSLIQSAGQVAGTAALNAAGVPWFVTSGASAWGGEAENALNSGATFDEANVSAAVAAVAEIVTEKIGGITYGETAWTEALTDGLTKNISDGFVKSLTEFGLDSLVFGEGSEEVLSELIGKFGQWITYQDENTFKDMFASQDALNSYIEAYIGGFVLGEGNNVLTNAGDFVKNKLNIGDKNSSGLVAVHNIGKDNLQKVINNGGFIAPSIAVHKRSGIKSSDFGEYTVLFDSDTIDPSINENNMLFGADAWTPTVEGDMKHQLYDSAKYNDVKTSILDMARRAINDVIDSTDNPSEIVSLRRIYDNDLDDRWFFKRDANKEDTEEAPSGMVYKLPADELAENVVQHIAPVLAYMQDSGYDSAKIKDYLLQGSTDLDIDNVAAKWLTNMLNGAAVSEPTLLDKYSGDKFINLMLEQPKRGISPMIAPQFNSIEEMVSHKNRLSAFGNVHHMDQANKLRGRLNDIVGIRDEYMIDEDLGSKLNFIENLYEQNIRYAGDILTAMRNAGFDITEQQSDSISKVFNKADHTKVEYMEAKPMRVVPLSEAKTVLAPANGDPEIIKKLEDAGIKVVEYQNAVDRLIKFFVHSGDHVIPNTSNAEVKPTYENHVDTEENGKNKHNVNSDIAKVQNEIDATKDKIAELTAEVQNDALNFDVVDECLKLIATEKSKLASLESELSVLESSIDNPVNYEVVETGEKTVSDIENSWNNITGDKATNYTVNVKYQVENAPEESQLHNTGSTGSGSYKSSGGAARVSGTAYADGNWGADTAETALVGELGAELRVNSKTGKWDLLGKNGAEFADINKGDIIFNHKQTEQLFKNGHVTSNGGRGKAFVNGTVDKLNSLFKVGTGNAYKFGLDTKELLLYEGYGQSGTVVPTLKSSAGKYITTNNNNPSNNHTPAVSNTSLLSGSDKDKFEETIDWVEVMIDRLERKIQELDTVVGSAYKSWTKRNEALVDEFKLVTDEIALQQKAYDTYMAKANSVSLSETYKQKVRDGKLQIEDITDEKLKEKIDDFQTWYEKALDCKDTITDLKEQLGDLAQTQFDNVVSEFDVLLKKIEDSTSAVEKAMEIVEAKGNMVSKSYYETLIANEKQTLATIVEQRDKMYAAYNDAITSGAITAGSEAAEEMLSSIREVEAAIQDSTLALIEFKNEMWESDWSVFEKTLEYINEITKESDFLVDLLSFNNEDLFSKTSGKLTDYGNTVGGLHAMDYNVFMADAQAYGDKIKEINAELAKDPTNTILLDKKNEYLELQREAIQNANDEKESIKSLIEESYNRMLDILQELIDERKKLLEAEKD